MTMSRVSAESEDESFEPFEEDVEDVVGSALELLLESRP